MAGWGDKAGAAPIYQTTITGNTAYTTPIGGYPTRHVGIHCTTWFEVESEHVVSWRYEGNQCTAY